MKEIDNDSEVLKLKDGRELGFIEVGDKKGMPFFYFHGFPGSRLEGKLGDKIVVKNSIHLICSDRPGVGLSDFQKNRTLLDWPDDMVELADHLGLEKFGVIGVSGGGPYAAACAYKIPDRLINCTIIAGIGPKEARREEMSKGDQIFLGIAKNFPTLIRFLLWVSTGRISNDLKKLEEKITKDAENLPEPDKLIMLEPDILHLFAIETKEAFRQGSKGLAYEAKLYAQSWNFQLEDIPATLKVNLWHGGLDQNVPIETGQYISNRIPNCHATFHPEEGHLSIIFNHQDEIFSIIKS
ncbi:MAG: alpha/beta hydrolase [Candidatus Lokiarchaeota archaeon]